MKPLPRLILKMIGELAILIGRTQDGLESEPTKRVRQVWTRHSAALAKAEADAKADEELD